MGFLVYILILCGAFLEWNIVKSAPTSSNTTFDVTKFGAVGDGESDDVKAFESAWAAACSASSENPNVTVPSGRTFLVSPIKFEGPCKSSSITFEGPNCKSRTTIYISRVWSPSDGQHIPHTSRDLYSFIKLSLRETKGVTHLEDPYHIKAIEYDPWRKILGTIIAHPREAWGSDDDAEWLSFNGVEGLFVVGNGQGVIDGQGNSWWGHGNEDNTPTAMRFSSCNKLHLSGLKHKDSPRNHISIDACNDAEISNLHITSPATSPNTDGIDIGSSSNLHIQDCVMETGDDCIAINGGTSFLNISRITCGPGHGISVGSLGKDGSHEEVEGIQVDNCTFIKTQNGVRIKTWQGGSGFAKNITFSNMNFVSASNPVIIDQYYCPGQKCDDHASAVEISDVRYIGLHGTSDSKSGIIKLSCSQTVACTGLVFDGLDIKGVGAVQTASSTTSARCINAHGTSDHLSNPAVDCLKP